MPQYALLPWTGEGTRENPFMPVGLRDGIDIIDIRPDFTKPDGWAIASIQDGLPLPAGAEFLANDIYAPVTGQMRGRLARLLGANMPDVTTLASLIVNILFYPPPGKWGRVQADSRGGMEVHLGDWHYRQDALLGFHAEETFDKPDSTVLGPVFSWTEVVGAWQVINNSAVGMTNDGVDRARCEQSCDTANHFVEITWLHANNANINAATGTLAACVRYSATADTCYFFEMKADRSGYYAGRLNAGVFTYWASSAALPATVSALPPPDSSAANVMYVRCQVDGSTIQGSVNGYVVHTQTDTTITGNTRIGMFVYDSSGDARFSEVNFGDMRATEKTSTLADDFTTMPVIGTTYENVSSSATVSNGELVLQQVPAYPNLMSRRLDLTESFVAVKVTDPTDMTAGSSRESKLEILAENSRQLRLSHQQTQLVMEASTNGRSDLTNINYDPTAHAWRRIRFSGSIAYFDTSPNGRDWTSRAQKTLTGWAPGNIKVMLQTGQWAGTALSPAPTSRFDNLNVLPLVYASDQAYNIVRNDWGTPTKDRSIEGTALTLRGVTYAKGFGTHANSEVRIPVPKGVTTFTAKIGIDDEVGAATVTDGAVFEIWNDANDTRLYQSAALNRQSAVVNVSITVTGRQGIRLKTIAGATDASDHTDWADAQFTVTGVQVYGGEILATGRKISTLRRTLTGSTRPAGVVTLVRAVLRVLTGSSRPTGVPATNRGVKVLLASLRPSGALLEVPLLRHAGTVATTGLMSRRRPTKRPGGSVTPKGVATPTYLGRVLGAAGTAIMRIKAAGEARMRFRRR